MAFRNRRSGTDTAAGQGQAGTEALPHGAGGDATTFIDEGCELIGDLRFSETVRIDGRVQGEIRAAKTVTVGESASIEAGVEAESVVVFGRVDGDIQARRKITLHKSARVSGELHSAGITIEEGARFRGCIVIGSDEVPPPSPEPATEHAPDPGAKQSAKGS